MTNPKATVKEGGRTFIHYSGWCPCGWEGVDRRYRSFAEADMREHKAVCPLEGGEGSVDDDD